MSVFELCMRHITTVDERVGELSCGVCSRRAVYLVHIWVTRTTTTVFYMMKDSGAR
jgi:hypothetical protein